MLNGQLNGALVGNGLRTGNALYERQRPVISVIWNSEEDFRGGDCRDSIIQNGADIWQRGNCHGRAVSITPFVGHEEDTVTGGPNGRVVMALIEQALLHGAGFGGQSHPEETTLRVEKTSQTGKECGIGDGQRAGQIFEIYVHTGVSPQKNRLQDLTDELFLNSRICQDEFATVGVELPCFGQCGKMHDGESASLPCGRQQGVIGQGDQIAGMGDSVCEWGQIGLIRQLFGQELFPNEWVGIAVGNDRSKGRFEIGDDKRFAGSQSFPAAQKPVSPPEITDRDAIAGRNGSQCFAGENGMHLLGEANHQCLSYGQCTVVGDAVIRCQTDWIHSIIGGNGINGVAGVDNMNRHTRSPLPLILWCKMVKNV